MMESSRLEVSCLVVVESSCVAGVEWSRGELGPNGRV